MGTDTSTIDIDLAGPLPAQMEEAQTLATNVVFQNRAVHILATDRDSLSSLGVRKESQREGEIRVIDVEGFDRSPCGGTHVQSTGEIGAIFVSNFERYKGGTRVEFAAGGRVLKLLQKEHELLRRLARIHSAAPDTLVEITEKCLQERTALTRENDLLESRLLEMEAADLLQSAPKTERGCLVYRTFSGRKLENVKVLAQNLTGNPNVVAILGIADACQIVLARSKDLQGNCGDAIKRVAAEWGGKGGGRPELAQAGGFPADCLDNWMKALAQYFKF
jgi:alanyl-tRNA synthetase